MRIDEIDLVGDLLLRGSSGSQGQVITYNSYGTLSWGAASSGGSSGSTQSYVKTVGQRYVLCETVNTNNPAADAITNGTNLGAAYSLAKTLNVGTKSPTNRVAVLLMPGRYNTNTLTLDTSYIDLIGVSSNALNTHLCSTSNYVLSYGNTVDSALQNVTFGTASILGLTGYGNNFLRWKNVVVTGKCFSDLSNFGLANIFGEFDKIVLKQDACFAISAGTVSGTFQNITSVDGYTAFWSNGVLSGTFSNILLKNTPAIEVFYGHLGIKGNYKDIIMRNLPSSVDSIFASNGTVNINVENFDFSGDPSVIFSGVNIYGNFRNLNITYDTAPNNSANIFNANNYLDINVKNLEIAPHFTYTSIFGNGTVGTISGTYENLSLYGEVSANVFRASHDINVEIRNMTSRTSGGVVNVLQSDGKINSILDKIDVNSCNNFAYSDGNLIGTFSNINVGAVSNNFFYSGANSTYLKGTFENIYAKVETYGFYSVGALEGSYKNIEFAYSDTEGEALFISDYGINGNFENILIRTGTTFFRVTDIGSVIGNFKKIRVMYKSGDYGLYPTVFKCDTSGIDLIMDDVIIRSSANTFQAFSTILGTYSNITIEDISGNLFYSEDANIYGNFENIDVIDRNNPLNASTYTFCANSSGSSVLKGKYKKIKIPGLPVHAGATRPVFGAIDISGDFEDIIIDTPVITNFTSVGYSSAFSDETGNLSSVIYDAKFKNIYVNRVPYLFQSATITDSVVIDNCYAPDSRFTSAFRGKLLNSTIGNKNLDWSLKVDFEDTPLLTLPPPAIIHNSKIVNDGSTYSINIINFGEGFPLNPYTRITRTATNGGINPLLNLITPNYNVNNSRVR